MTEAYTTERKISDLITPLIEESGLRLVQVRLTTDQNSTILRVMAEHPETRNLGVDECAALSREISAILDVEDPVKSNYRLEVSSPGIDRPLTALQDFADFQSFEAKVEIEPPLDGQKRFRGYIKSVENESDIVLATDEGDVTLPFAAMRKAKLVMTDDLLQRMKKISKKQEKEQATD